MKQSTRFLKRFGTNKKVKTLKNKKISLRIGRKSRNILKAEMHESTFYHE